MTEPVAPEGFAADPSGLLEEVFREVLRTRFDGVPLLNPALEVEAVGFTRTSGGWLGVMVTPWFMNLMLLPARGASWHRLPVGEKRAVSLPAGKFDFFGGREEAIGEYLYCSMFSPMSQFADHESAHQTARQVAAMLFDPNTAEIVREQNPSGLAWFESKPKPAEEAAARSDDVSDSKRRFLRSFRPGTRES
jgi:[NiFe] hydrogenase assembly HybE family chaperone